MAGIEEASPPLPQKAVVGLHSLPPHLLCTLWPPGRLLMGRQVNRQLRENMLHYAKGMRLRVGIELEMPKGVRAFKRLLKSACNKVALEVVTDSCAQYCVPVMLDKVDDLTVTPLRSMWAMGMAGDWNSKGVAHAQLVAHFLRNDKLRKLCVKGPNFLDDSLKILTEALEKNDKAAPSLALEVLELNDVPLKYDGYVLQWQRVLKGLPSRFPNLRQLCLRLARGFPALELGRCLAEMRQLQRLELVQVKLKRELKHLMQGLSYGGGPFQLAWLTELVIYECELKDEDVQPLVNWLKLTPSLVSLHLIKLKIPLRQLLSVGEQVASLTVLERLRIREITHEEPGVQDLAPWLRQCTLLRELAINSLSLNNDTLLAAVGCLEQCTNLQSLDISRNVQNHPPVAGRARNLGELLAGLPALTTLVARGNNFSLEEQKDICQSVAAAEALRRQACQERGLQQKDACKFEF